MMCLTASCTHAPLSIGLCTQTHDYAEASDSVNWLAKSHQNLSGEVHYIQKAKNLASQLKLLRRKCYDRTQSAPFHPRHSSSTALTFRIIAGLRQSLAMRQHGYPGHRYTHHTPFLACLVLGRGGMYQSQLICIRPA